MYKVILKINGRIENMGKYPSEKAAQYTVIKLRAIKLEAYYMKEEDVGRYLTPPDQPFPVTPRGRRKTRIDNFIPIKQLPLLKIIL